jgi:hypothetical protein
MSGIRLVIDEFRADVTDPCKDGSTGAPRIDYGDSDKPADVGPQLPASLKQLAKALAPTAASWASRTSSNPTPVTPLKGVAEGTDARDDPDPGCYRLLR